MNKVEIICRESLPESWRGLKLGSTSWESRLLFLHVIQRSGIPTLFLAPSEMVGSTDGIGHFILDSQGQFKVDQMCAGMLSLALLGYLLNQLFHLFYGSVLAWHRGLTRAEQ